MTENFKNDFLGWAEKCVRITDKLTGQTVPFRPNAPQRRVLAIMEEQRRAGKPIRIILLKARQWGGSTLVQVYMAWLQLVCHKGWNSVVCAHVKDAAAGIRGMYSRLLREYPEALRTGKGKDWVLSPYEKSASVVEIAARDCRITLATAGAPNSVRGSNFAMAHLSEVAFWGDGDSSAAEEIVRTICGSVPRVADSLIVMESTANGRGGYFYDEWQRAAAGKSDKTPVFVPWHEIEIYRRDVADDERQDIFASLDDYEKSLIEEGVALESVAWYHDKRREYPTHEAMMAEFPSTAEEAFSASGLFDAFSEEELPLMTDNLPAPSRQSHYILSIIVSPDIASRAISALRLDGERLTAIAEIDSTGTFPVVAARCLRWCQKYDASVIIGVAEASRGAAGHAKWLIEKLEEEGVEVYHNEEDEALVVLDETEVCILVDRHRELVADSRILEMQLEMPEQYRAFRTDSPSASPGVCARLLALKTM
ncbi:MAG: hypothetical protein HDS70_04920 [Bacteroidales bacterium]|nr:hypothetical protein [Bacteroidales bacterium]